MDVAGRRYRIVPFRHVSQILELWPHLNELYSGSVDHRIVEHESRYKGVKAGGLVFFFNK